MKMKFLAKLIKRITGAHKKEKAEYFNKLGLHPRFDDPVGRVVVNILELLNEDIDAVEQMVKETEEQYFRDTDVWTRSSRNILHISCVGNMQLFTLRRMVLLIPLRFYG